MNNLEKTEIENRETEREREREPERERERERKRLYIRDHLVTRMSNTVSHRGKTAKSVVCIDDRGDESDSSSSSYWSSSSSSSSGSSLIDQSPETSRDKLPVGPKDEHLEPKGPQKETGTDELWGQVGDPPLHWLPDAALPTTVPMDVDDPGDQALKNQDEMLSTLKALDWLRQQEPPTPVLTCPTQVESEDPPPKLSLETVVNEVVKPDPLPPRAITPSHERVEDSAKAQVDREDQRHSLVMSTVAAQQGPVCPVEEPKPPSKFLPVTLVADNQGRSNGGSNRPRACANDVPPWRLRRGQDSSLGEDLEVWDQLEHEEVQRVFDLALRCIRAGTRVLDNDGCLRHFVTMVREEGLLKPFEPLPETLTAGRLAINPPYEVSADKLPTNHYLCPMPLCQQPFTCFNTFEKHLLNKCKNGKTKLKAKSVVKSKFPWLQYYRQETVIYRSLKYLQRAEQKPKMAVKQIDKEVEKDTLGNTDDPDPEPAAEPADSEAVTVPQTVKSLKKRDRTRSRNRHRREGMVLSRPFSSSSTGDDEEGRVDKAPRLYLWVPPDKIPGVLKLLYGDHCGTD